MLPLLLVVLMAGRIPGQRCDPTSHFFTDMDFVSYDASGMAHQSWIEYAGFHDSCGGTHTTFLAYGCDGDPCAAKELLDSGWLPPGWTGQDGGFTRPSSPAASDSKSNR